MKNPIPDENYTKALKELIEIKTVNLKRLQATFKNKSFNEGYLKNVSVDIKSYKETIKALRIKLNEVVKLQKEDKKSIKSKKMAGLKKFDVVYSTKSGRLMVAKSIMANNEAEAKEKLKTQMRASSTFDKVKLAMGLNSSLPKGMTKVIAKNIKITGLSKTTGRILKGYKYAKGGKIVKVSPKK